MMWIKPFVVGSVPVAVLACGLAGPARAADQAALAAIAAATGGKLRATKGVIPDKDCGQDVGYKAEALDLNGDGQLEVLTQEFGACYGRAGVQMNLYIKAKSKGKGGAWQPQFGFAGTPRILPARSQGFPDIEVLGPGPCFPVWRYNGKQYEIVKRCP